jgi:protein associated with RNAse G/E
MTTEPVWRRRGSGDGGPEWEVTMVDLDLDVVLTREGHLYVDDEDEFAQHRVELDYPEEVVALAERWRDRVHTAVAAGDEPFATVGHAWLRRAESGEGEGR